MAKCSNPKCKNYDPKVKELCTACWLNKRNNWLEETFGTDIKKPNKKK